MTAPLPVVKQRSSRSIVLGLCLPLSVPALMTGWVAGAVLQQTPTIAAPPSQAEVPASMTPTVVAGERTSVVRPVRRSPAPVVRATPPAPVPVVPPESHAPPTSSTTSEVQPTPDANTTVPGTSNPPVHNGSGDGTSSLPSPLEGLLGPDGGNP